MKSAKPWQEYILLPQGGKHKRIWGKKKFAGSTRRTQSRVWLFSPTLGTLKWVFAVASQIEMKYSPCAGGTYRFFALGNGTQNTQREPTWTWTFISNFQISVSCDILLNFWQSKLSFLHPHHHLFCCCCFWPSTCKWEALFLHSLLWISVLLHVLSWLTSLYFLHGKNIIIKKSKHCFVRREKSENWAR